MTVALLKYYERNKQKSQTKFMKTGYSIRTWRMRLVCPEPIWLDRTEEYFQNVVEFYYHLLRQHEELWNSSLFDIQRSLELLTLAGRDGRQPTNPLPMGKVPVYLRRAAINKASATVKSTQELQSGFPEKLEAKVAFFKGMYSDLTDRSICLKLWNGEKWIWTDCELKGRPFPQDGQLMSPTLVKEGRRYLLNIPVKQENSDARTAKERMAEGTNLCSVRFTNTDTFAVCCILDEQGNQLAVHTCRGGDAYRHRCKLLETRIQKSRPNTVGDNSPQPNRKYYMHLKNLSEHYAHQVSREIVEYCKAHEVGIIAFPKYAESYEKHVKKASGNYSALHLSTRIREYLTYKAWQSGILVIDIHAKGLHENCAVCGANIVSVDKKTQECTCEAGHKTNRYLNIARNTAKRCLTQFQRTENIR